MTTGERIKKARKEAGITQKQLGEMLDLSFQAIAQWENDLRKPKPETTKKIAAKLGVNPADIDENLVINLGSDVMTKLPNGEFITVPGGTKEAEVLTVLHCLNDNGQTEWIKRGEEMIKIPDYQRKKVSEPEDND